MTGRWRETPIPVASITDVIRQNPCPLHSDGHARA